MVFYTLTLLSCAVEVGLVTTLLIRQASFWEIALVLAAYHAGYLVEDIISGRRGLQLRIFGWLVLALTPALGLVVVPGRIIPLAFAVFGIMSGIQTVRFTHKAYAPYSSQGKALYRYIGYVLGGLIGMAPWLLIPVGIYAGILILQLSRKKPDWKTWQAGFQRYGIKPLLVFTFFHHAQYFSFVYFLMYRSISQFSWPVWIAGAFLLIGWLGYSLVESQLNQYRTAVIAGGHLLNGVAVISLPFALVASEGWLLTVWLVTGILGGTAYASAQLPGMPKRGTKGIRNLVEHLGHVCGVAISGLVLTFTHSLFLVFFVAGVLSLASGIALCFQSCPVVGGNLTDMVDEGKAERLGHVAFH